MEKASNIFSRMDTYWDSDQSFIDEFKHLETEHLVRLRDTDQCCLAKMAEVTDPKDYWQWRIDQGMIDPWRRKPLADVKQSTERHLRCVLKVLEGRIL